MRPKLLKLFLLLSIVASLASVGLAQEGAAPAAQKPAPTSPEDMIAQGQLVVDNGAALSATVSGLIGQATDDGDMMKVTCLKDKLTAIDGNLSTAQQHLIGLRKATDPGVRAHEHTMIMVVGGMLDVLGQEAGQCVGQDLYETGQTTVDTIIDTDMLPFEDNPSVPPMILPPSLPTLPPPESGMR